MSSWWNPFSTEAGNGKTSEQLDSERAALDRQRQARAEAYQLYLEEEGFADEARDAARENAEYNRIHVANLERQDEALRESPLAAFQDEVRIQANNRRQEATSAILGTLGTTLRLVPWPVWVALGLYLAWQLGLIKKALAKL